MNSISLSVIFTKLKVTLINLLERVKEVMLGRRFIVITIIECFMLCCSVKFSFLVASSLSYFNRGIELHMQLLFIVLATTSILTSAVLFLINTKEETEQSTIRVDNIRDVVGR